MTRQIPDYVGEHFAKHPASRVGTRPAIHCKDGWFYSVQANGGLAYCSPKSDEGPWTSFEVWGCNGTRWTTRDPVGWVPKDKINRLIHRHGGAV
jgi:hypothetical protein